MRHLMHWILATSRDALGPATRWSLHWLVAVLLLLAGQVAAQSDDPFSSSRASFSSAAFLPVNEAFRLQLYSNDEQLWLHWMAAPGYYLYEERFGLVDEQRQALDLQLESHHQPTAKYDEFFERDMMVYYGEALLSLPLAQARQLGTFGVTSQGCADAGLCYEPQTHFIDFEGDRPRLLSGAPPASTPPTNTLPTSAASSLGGWAAMLLFALIGGMVLNLMPCVFPVLSIKAMHFATQHHHGHNPHLHGLAYCAGIVTVFVLFAAVLYSFRASGELAGWGFQLQSPLFIAYLAYLFTALGLSLSGLIMIGGSLMNLGQTSLSQSQGLRASFLTGALASIVASPCTAPFMGIALGFAITQPAVLGLSIFVALGVGMALPLLLLAWWPGLAERMPAPGPWMETFKQLLAFPLYLTVVWLLWVLGRQTSTDYLTTIIVGLVAIAFGAWLWQRHKLSGSRISQVSAVVALIAALLLPLADDRSHTGSADLTAAYTPERLASLLDEGNPVFVNLTADWCITCLANEQAVLNTNRFHELLEQRRITYLTGDWTNGDPIITQLLEEYGRTGVPLYLLFAPGKNRAEVLPQILRFSTIHTEVDKISQIN